MPLLRPSSVGSSEQIPPSFAAISFVLDLSRQIPQTLSVWITLIIRPTPERRHDIRAIHGIGEIKDQAAHADALREVFLAFRPMVCQIAVGEENQRLRFAPCFETVDHRFLRTPFRFRLNIA